MRSAATLLARGPPPATSPHQFVQQHERHTSFCSPPPSGPTGRVSHARVRLRSRIIPRPASVARTARRSPPPVLLGLLAALVITQAQLGSEPRRCRRNATCAASVAPAPPPSAAAQSRRGVRPAVRLPLPTHQQVLAARRRSPAGPSAARPWTCIHCGRAIRHWIPGCPPGPVGGS